VRLEFLVAIAGGCGFSTSLTNPPADAPPDVAIDAPPQPICFQERCRRKTITIDHTKVTGGPLLQFPLYVKLADADFANAAPLGTDFAFVAGTTALPFERERFANNELVAWVAIPSLSSTTDTVIGLYYGDPTATDLQNRAAVWDTNYQAVWHLGETTGGTNAIKDSTSRANNGTDNGGLALGGAAQLGFGAAFDGVDDHIQVPTSATLTDTAALATLGMWVKWTQATGTDYQRLLMTSNTLANDDSGPEWATNMMGQYYYYPSNAGGNNYAAIITPFTNGMWHHVVVTHNFATKAVAIYFDGAQRVLDFDNTPTNWTNLTNPAPWYWGGAPPRTKFAGMMDEIRVSKSIRSAGWIATEYANQKSPSTFYAVD